MARCEPSRTGPIRAGNILDNYRHIIKTNKDTVITCDTEETYDPDPSYHVLHWVRVKCHNSNRSRPLVMDLMDALVERRVVNKPDDDRR